MIGWTGGWALRWLDGCRDGWVGERTEEVVHRWKYECIYKWLGGLVDG